MKRSLCAVLAMMLLLAGMGTSCSREEATDDNQQHLEEQVQINPDNPRVHWVYSDQCFSGDLFIAEEYVVNQTIDKRSFISYDLKTGEKNYLLECDGNEFIVMPPAVSGTCLAWVEADIRGVDREVRYDVPGDIFVYDMHTGKKQQITDDPYDQVNVVISGNWVAWLDDRNDSGELAPYRTFRDVYAYNLDTGEERRITENPTAEGYGDLFIDGDLIVWTDNRYGNPEIINRPDNIADYNNEIFVYNLATGVEKRVTTYPNNDHYPVVSGNRIAWLRQLDLRQGAVVVYDLDTEQETVVSSSRYAGYAPSMSGDHIVWSDAAQSKGNTSNDVIENGVPGSADIYTYDFSTGVESLLVPSTVTGVKRVLVNAVLSENYLVYTVSRQIGPLVYMQKIAWEQTISVSDNLKAQFFEIEKLDHAQEYRVVEEMYQPSDSDNRTAGTWLITSQDAGTAEERAQTVMQATVDLFRLYNRDFTSVILVPGESQQLLRYASASFAADGLGAYGLTGSVPAVPGYWKVRTTPYTYSDLELKIAGLWWENMDRFPPESMWSSKSYDEQALKEYIADTLNISSENVRLPHIILDDYGSDEQFRDLTKILTANRTSHNPETELILLAWSPADFAFGGAEPASLDEVAADIPPGVQNEFVSLYTSAEQVSQESRWMIYSSWRPYTQSEVYQDLLKFCRERGETVLPLVLQQLDSENPRFAGGLVIDSTLPAYLYYYNRGVRREGLSSSDEGFSGYVDELLMLLLEKS